MRAPGVTRDRAVQLRRMMSLPEGLLWRLLRSKQLGLRFRRQHPLGPYVLDFYCPSHRLCVEIDGCDHATREAQDARRDAWLAEHGVRTLRIPASWVLNDESIDGVLALIAETAQR